MPDAQRTQLPPVARAAVQGLAALWALGLQTLIAAAVVWWLVFGPGWLTEPGRAGIAVLGAVALAMPALVLLHFWRSLRRAAFMIAELADRTAAGERFDGPPGFFFRSIRMAMRQRGIGVLARPWYWAIAAWGFGSSIALILAAMILVVRALI